MHYLGLLIFGDSLLPSYHLELSKHNLNNQVCDSGLIEIE